MAVPVEALASNPAPPKAPKPAKAPAPALPATALSVVSSDTMDCFTSANFPIVSFPTILAKSTLFFISSLSISSAYFISSFSTIFACNRPKLSKLSCASFLALFNLDSVSLYNSFAFSCKRLASFVSLYAS